MSGVSYSTAYNGNENEQVTEEIRQYNLYVQQPDETANNARTKLLLNNTVFIEGGAGAGFVLPGSAFQTGAPFDILNNAGGLSPDQLTYNRVKDGRFNGSVPKKLSFFLDNTYDGTVVPPNPTGDIATLAGDLLIAIKNADGDDIFALAGIEAITGLYNFTDNTTNAGQLLCMWDGTSEFFVVRPLGTKPATGGVDMQIVLNFDVAELGTIFVGDGS